MAKQSSAPTMKDVAKEAGVSLGTVSKVINGIPVGEEYRKKVEQAIKELDYHLNAYARGLKSNRTNTIAVVLPTIAHPYFGLIAHCINSSLQKRGYRVTARNYRCRFGEIDIIAENRMYLVFAEVKLRRTDYFGAAREFVDARKQERLRQTALLWLEGHETRLQPRFDVIEIYAPDGMQTKCPQIRQMEDAFI